MIIDLKESSAGSAVGTDLMANNKYKLHRLPRRVTHMAVAGSAAAGDSSVDLIYGDRNIATKWNSTGGAVLAKADADLFPNPGTDYIRPFEPLSVVVSDASGTNPLNVVLCVQELSG